MLDIIETKTNTPKIFSHTRGSTTGFSFKKFHEYIFYKKIKRIMAMYHKFCIGGFFN